MRNILVLVNILGFFSGLFFGVQTEEKKKEPVYTVISTKYVLTSTIVDDFFRAAKITTYSYNKEEINKIKIHRKGMAPPCCRAVVKSLEERQVK